MRAEVPAAQHTAYEIVQLAIATVAHFGSSRYCTQLESSGPTQ